MKKVLDEGAPHWHARARGQWVPLDARIAQESSGAATAAALEVASGGWTAGASDTVNEYTKRWLASREGRVNSIRDDRSRMRDHVQPLIGELEAGTFTRDDVENVRDAKIASGALNWKTARNVWATFTSPP